MGNEIPERPDTVFGKIKLPGRALLVEDNKDQLELLKRMLLNLGIEGFAVSSPMEAFKIFEEQKGGFDYLITDMVLPELPGIILAERLKEKKPDLKVVLISGYSDRISEISKFLSKYGDVAFLPKPFTLTDLAEVLVRITQKSPKHS